MKKPSFFNTNFQNPFEDVDIAKYQDVKLCDTNMAFEYKVKFQKKASFI